MTENNVCNNVCNNFHGQISRKKRIFLLRSRKINRMP